MHLFKNILKLDKEYHGWSVERVVRHVLYWGFWLNFYGVLNGTLVDCRYLEWFLLELSVMTVKLPYAYFVAYFLFPHFLPQRKYFTLGFLVIMFAFLSIALIVMINRNFPFELADQPTTFWSLKTFYQTLDLIYMASLVVVIKMVQQYFRQKRMNTQLMEEKMKAELQILKNQLQPHFLFNTLNNIYSLVIYMDQRAGDCVLMLSNIISYMLYECNGEQVSLSKEVEMLRNYVQLEKIRYGERLDLSFEVNGCTSGKVIAPLLLIPFVENAFKHGISKSTGNSWIRIDLQMEEDRLSFLVENKLPGTSENNSTVKSGIGLENVKKRLQLLYPDNHKLSMSQSDSFLINLTIRL